MVALSQWSEINRYKVHCCLRVFFLDANKMRLGEAVIDRTDSGVYGYERRGKAEQGSEVYELSNIPLSELRNLAVWISWDGTFHHAGMLDRLPTARPGVALFVMSTNMAKSELGKSPKPYPQPQNKPAECNQMGHLSSPDPWRFGRPAPRDGCNSKPRSGHHRSNRG